MKGKMYKDKEKQKEANRLAKQRQRGMTRGMTSGDVTANMSYPSIIYALTDPIKRQKLEKIYQSLSGHNVAHLVYYGVSGLDFDTVGELLEIT